MAFSFEDLEVYKKSVNFVDKVYRITKDFPKEELYGVTSQIKRASVSIPANIAEGSGRFNKKDFAQYLRIARGSVYECIPLIEICFRAKFIDKDVYEALLLDCNELARMLNGLISSLLNRK